MSHNGRMKYVFCKLILKDIVRQDDELFVEALNQLRLGDPKCLSYFNTHLMMLLSGIRTGEMVALKFSDFKGTRGKVQEKRTRKRIF